MMTCIGMKNSNDILMMRKGIFTMSKQDKELMRVRKQIDGYLEDKEDLLRDTAEFIVSRYDLTHHDLICIMERFDLDKQAEELLIKMFETITDKDYF